MSEEFANREKYSNCQISINFAFTDFEANLKGINSIKDFFESENEYWGSLEQHSNPTKHFSNHFRSCVSSIQNFINQNKNTDDNQFKRNWNNLHSEISNNQANNHHILPSKTAEGEFIFELTKENTTQASAAYDFICNRNLNFKRREQSIGYIKAYEFLLQHENQIKKRRDSEKKSIGHLRNDFNELISELRAEFDENVDRYVSWRETFTEDLENWKSDYKEDFDNWNVKVNNEFRDFLQSSKEKVNNLEDLYTEKLRLAGPVDHWNNRAEEHKIAGKIWAGLLTTTVISVAIVLIYLLYNPPEVFETNLLNGDPGSLKGFVLFVALISFFGFLIGAFSKLTFSSYHLRRDAEEREQLTHVYLALKEEGKISEDERNLVLQSIFSRADTGLLKGEHSPIMPGMRSIIENMKN